MRRSTLWLCSLAAGLLLLVTAFGQGFLQRQQSSVLLAEKAALVSSLGLTDLCLFTEARYTRHPSQADLNSPFQDHPFSLEHFPSGSLIPVPRTRMERHALVD